MLTLLICYLRVNPGVASFILKSSKYQVFILKYKKC